MKEVKRENVHKTFEEISHTPLRVYNRVVMMFNLRESVSKEEAQRYVELFEPSERKQMWAMMVFIKQKGKDEAYKFVTRGLEFVDD